MKKMACLLTLIAILPMASCDRSNTTQETPDTKNLEMLTPRDNLAELLKVSPIAGEPERVWWLRLPMGKHTASSIAGPTDIQLVALIDYGSEAAAKQVLVDSSAGSTFDARPATWFPEDFNNAIGSNSLYPAQEHTKVNGFHPDARLWVPTNLPSFMVLRQVF